VNIKNETKTENTQTCKAACYLYHGGRVFQTEVLWRTSFAVQDDIYINTAGTANRLRSLLYVREDCTTPRIPDVGHLCGLSVPTDSSDSGRNSGADTCKW